MRGNEIGTDEGYWSIGVLWDTAGTDTPQTLACSGNSQGLSEVT